MKTSGAFSGFGKSVEKLERWLYSGFPEREYHRDLTFSLLARGTEVPAVDIDCVVLHHKFKTMKAVISLKMLPSCDVEEPFVHLRNYYNKNIDAGWSRGEIVHADVATAANVPAFCVVYDAKLRWFYIEPGNTIAKKTCKSMQFDTIALVNWYRGLSELPSLNASEEAIFRKKATGYAHIGQRVREAAEAGKRTVYSLLLEVTERAGL